MALPEDPEQPRDQPTPEDEALDRAARLLAAAGEANLDVHPSDDELVAYWEGTLSAEERDRLEGDLALSRDGTRRLLELIHIARAEEKLPKEELDSAWQRFTNASEANASEASAERDGAERSQPPPLAPRPVSAHPEASDGEPLARPSRWPLALAASLFFATCALLVWALQLQQQLRSTALPRENITIVEMFSEEKPYRQLGSPDAYDLSFEHPRLVLILHRNADAPDFSEYRGILRDGAGEIYWRSEPLLPNPFGSFTLELSRSFLPPGEYSLQIEGSSAGAQASLESYRLRVLPPQSSGPVAKSPEDAPP